MSAPVADVVSKRYRAGTHRIRPPAQTVSRVRPLLPVLGVTRIADVTGLDRIGIPVVMVTRPNSRSLSVSQGKGLDLDGAMASGVMESIEAYHAERVELPLRLASVDDLAAGDDVVDPHSVPWAITADLDPSMASLWVQGSDLHSETSVWVPFDLVHLDYTGQSSLGIATHAVTSNGLASGNSLAEAMVHGICELIERDAQLLARLAPERHRRRRVDLHSVHDRRSRELVDRFAAADMLLGVWDVTSNVGVPAFVARAVDRTDDADDRHLPSSGAGCHPCREVAFCRAVTEVAQSRLTYIAGSRDDLYPSTYRAARSPRAIAAFRAAVLDETEAARSFDRVPTVDHDSVVDDLDWLVERLVGAGLKRVVMVDLTRRAFGVPVVRAIVPGLEGPADRIEGYVPGPRAAALL